MEIKLLVRANRKKHRGSLIGIFILLLISSLSLTTVLTVWRNSSEYVNHEMQRLGFGEITAWVSGVTDWDVLVQEVSALEDVKEVGVQPIFYSEYRIGEQESDSEGQLITYDPDSYSYKIFEDSLSGYKEADLEIQPGEIYVSPSLCSMFGVEIGDSITFPIARNGVNQTFVIKGYFEDPFMGSSMIGMKSFLICEQDHDNIAKIIADSGSNGLAREGFMLHIFQNPNSSLSTAEWNTRLNERTSLPHYVEFTHSYAAIAGFMVTLQNVFTGFLVAFVVILVLVSMVVLGQSIGSTIEQDYVNMGILKTIGFTTKKLKTVQMIQYLIGILSGMAIGCILAIWTTEFVCGMTVTTTGILVPANLPIGLCLLAFGIILLLLLGFIWIKTGKIKRITPLSAVQYHGVCIIFCKMHRNNLSSSKR